MSSKLTFLAYLAVAIVGKSVTAEKQVRSAAPYCQGEDNLITGTQGQFNSPNYPQNYNAGDDCNLFLNSENDQFIELIIHDFLIENRFDTLRLVDGADFNNPLVELSGGPYQDLVYCSSHPTVFLSFTADGAIQNRGFNITWKEFPRDQRPTTCLNL